MNSNNKKKSTNKKIQSLDQHTKDGTNEFLTTNQGVRINDNQNTLTAGERGPSLLEDFIFREKMTHFDHERIPERIVHARGSGAHGYFQVYESMKKVTKAGFLQDPSKQTPVFVRFSTVAGFRGSTDLARDARGFSVKFYTEEGNYDLVGNNMPVFFIQDGMKFPDLIHAVKPEPHNEIPQAGSAHDTFWDFISLMPESMHMIMWVMSDRAIPRSYRMMEGFGVHTFRFINENGKSTFVKFHWKPVLGTHGVTWDEAQKISGKNSDFHRQDLWEAIEEGNFPEFELGVQLVPDEEEHNFDFDLLDPTKLIPEEIVPVQKIGKMVLNRNPDNFFAETEQIAFHPGHVVPGIDFTNDPLLQGRLFSYLDTQLIRLGGPNFNEIPINRPIAANHNNQRDGSMRQQINKGKVSYHPNSLGGGCPFQAKMTEGGFVSHNEKVEGHKVRTRSKSFNDFFSQATLFFKSQTAVEQQHMIDALGFELGKVETIAIRTRMVGLLSLIDDGMAKKVAKQLGIDYPVTIEKPINQGVPADAGATEFEPTSKKQSLKSSDALSMLKNLVPVLMSRQVAILCDEEVDEKSLIDLKKALEAKKVMVKIIAPRSGKLKLKSGKEINIDHSFLTTDSVLFDGVIVADGKKSTDALQKNIHAIHFLNESYRHCKPIGIFGSGKEVWQKSMFAENKDNKTSSFSQAGIFIDKNAEQFMKGLEMHRFWEREKNL